MAAPLDALLVSKPSLLHIASAEQPGWVQTDRIDGASAGLTFSLALASHALDRPLPNDLVATAEVDPVTLDLRPVEFTAQKVAALRLIAPRAWRLVVAQGQELPADLAGIIPVPLARLEDALNLAFGDGWIRQVVEAAGREAFGRNRLVRRLFRQCMGGRMSVDSWATTHRAASLAMEILPVDRSAEQFEVDVLGFVRAVADRLNRVGGGTPFALDDAWLESLPPDDRIGVVTHYVQHAVDVGDPPAGIAKSRAVRELPNERQWLPHHARLAGALGRLVSRCEGRLEEAREWQERALQYWLRRGCRQSLETDVAYPLSESYLLASWADPDFAERWISQLESVWRDVGFTMSVTGSSWVQLTRGRALLAIGEVNEGIKSLDTVASARRLRYELRLSARRWRIRAFATSGRHAEAESARTQLKQEVEAQRHSLFQSRAGDGSASGRERVLDLVLALVALDEAVLTGGAGDFTALTESVKVSGGWPAQVAARATPTGDLLSVARALMDRYPY
ncbi:MAG: hypothetical protein IPJ56_02565 [Gemmatimonadetes bacterium]|nr:hypothetical protein [Gemmatimonadota bacterium]